MAWKTKIEQEVIEGNKITQMLFEDINPAPSKNAPSARKSRL